MNFLSSLIAVAYKEFVHIRRDPITLVIAFVVPIFQLIIFGYAIDMDVKNIPTAVYDADGRQTGRDFVASLENTGYFKVLFHVDSDEKLYREIVSGKVRVGVKIPRDFSDKMTGSRKASALVMIDGSSSTEGMQALNVASAIGLVRSMQRVGKGGVTTLPLEVRSRVLFNPDLKSANFFVPGLVGLIMQLVSVFLTAFSIVRERERGTLEQLLVTPVSRGGLILGKIIPFGVIAFTEICVVLTIMRLVFGVEIAGNLWLLLAMCFLFLFTGLGLGVLISTAARNQAQAMQMAFLIMLPSIMLSGFVFPRESMPHVIYYFTFLVPLTYFIEILRGIIIRGANFSDIWQNAACLAAYGLVIVTISTLRFRKRLS